MRLLLLRDPETFVFIKTRLSGRSLAQDRLHPGLGPVPLSFGMERLVLGLHKPHLLAGDSNVVTLGGETVVHCTRYPLELPGGLALPPCMGFISMGVLGPSLPVV